MTIAAGAPLGPWTIESVSPQSMKALAVILDDPNPIHLDPAAVRDLGLGDRVINQGPANLSYVLNMLMESIPGARIAGMRARFVANVLGGDRVTAAGEVLAVREHDSGRCLECAAWLDVQGRGRAIEATATLLLAGG